jgi:hypothetical protein
MNFLFTCLAAFIGVLVADVSLGCLQWLLKDYLKKKNKQKQQKNNKVDYRR